MAERGKDSAKLRFVPNATGLDDFFRRYEQERLLCGLASTLHRVSPGQRIDTITTILGLNRDGWLPAEADTEQSLWLRYLKPVLAETRESAVALSFAVDGGLPGTFDPPLAPPVESDGPAADRESVEAERPVKPEQSPKTDEPAEAEQPVTSAVKEPLPGWPAELLKRVIEALRTQWQAQALAAAIILAAVFGALHFAGVDAKAWKWLFPDPQCPPTCWVGADDTVPRPKISPQPHRDVKPPPPDPNDPVGDDFRTALAVTMAAVAQHNDDLTPRALAEIYAGESDVVDQPEIFLAAMLEQWPELPNLPIRRDDAGTQALLHYAAAFATIETGRVVAPRTPTPVRSDEELRLFTLLGEFVDRGLAEPIPQEPPPTAPGGTWPQWLPYTVFGLLLPALLIAAATYPAAVRASLVNPPAGLRGKSFDLPLDGLVQSALRPARKLARRIAWREPVVGRRIHAGRSIKATLAQGGFISVVMRKRTLLAEYVFLVNRRRLNDHESPRVSRLIETLSRGGLNVTIYDYDPDPRTITARHRDDNAPLVTFDLRGLRERHPDARLVLVTDGSELVDYFTLDPLPFVAEELATWPGRMLLTPIPVAEWGEREMKISEALAAPIGRATLAGFRGLALAFGDRRKPPRPGMALPSARNDDLLKRTVTWLIDAQRRVPVEHEPGARPAAVRLDEPFLRSDTPPSPEAVTALLRELHAWLGPRGFHWLAACAHYPELRFPITIYLGLKIEVEYGPTRTVLYSEALLAQLALLPWFRSGHMPPWLRTALLGSLTDTAFEQVAQAVADMLKGKSLPSDGRPPPQATKLPIWLSGGEGLDIPLDAVMADMTTPDQDVRAPKLDDEAMSRLLGPHRRHAIGVRLLALAGVALWCGAAWWLWPDPLAAPHARGAWLPLLALVLSTLVAAALAAVLAWTGYLEPASANEVAP